MLSSLYKPGEIVILRPDLRSGCSYVSERSDELPGSGIVKLTANDETERLKGLLLIIDEVLQELYDGIPYIVYTVRRYSKLFVASMFSDYEERIKPFSVYTSFYDYLGGDNNAGNKV